jgi:hypothetical protein
VTGVSKWARIRAAETTPLLKLSVRIGAPSIHGPEMPSEDVPEGNIWRDNAGRVSAFLSGSCGEFRLCFPQFAAYIFPNVKCQERVQIVIEPGPMTTREQLVDRLTRNVIPLLLQSRGIQVLHGSAVRVKDGVVGLCGRSFTGKSTLAYALGVRGYEVWADDALLISTTAEPVKSLKSPLLKLRLRPDARKHFGEIESSSFNGARNEDEFELSLSEMKESPLKALYLIYRASNKEEDRVFRCNKLNGHKALKRILELANYYNLKDVFEYRRIVESCLSVVSRVPIYNCDYRGGFEFIQEVVDEFEQSFSIGPLEVADSLPRTQLSILSRNQRP